MTNNPKKWLGFCFAALLLAGLLLRSFLTNPAWRAFDSAAFLESLISVHWGWMGWALVAIYSTYLVRALRWKALTRPAKPDASLWNIFSATVIGFAAIGIFGRAGEMVRPYMVARKEGMPVSSQMGVWVLERSFDTLTILITVALALRHFNAAGLRSSPALTRALQVSGSVVAFGTVGLLMVIVALRNFAEPSAAWLLDRLRFLSPPRYKWVEHSLLAFVGGSRGIGELRSLAVCTLYSIAQWVLIALCYTAVFNSFSGGLRLSLNDTLIFMGSVMAGSMVQIPGVGGGVQVAAVVVLTEVFGLRPELAASISLLIWVFTFLVVVPPALLLAFHEGLSWRKLRRLESES